MNKKHLLLVALLSEISLVAMDHIQGMPSGKGAFRNEEEVLVKIRLSDCQNSEITHDEEIPVRLAKLLGALNTDLLEDSHVKGSVFPLPNVTIAIWRFIELQLERVYGITYDASQTIELRKAIMTEFRKLDSTSLIRVICASEYLDIPILLDSACEVAKKSALDTISWEELEVLPWHIRNQIIMYKGLMLFGPVPAKQLMVCRGHGSWVNSVCIAQDGKLVSGSDDKTVHIWDMEGNRLAVCRGHEDGITSVCVTNDGKIVSGSNDSTVRVWDMEGNQLVVCRGHEGRVGSVGVTNDGKIVSASQDKTVRVWDMQGNPLVMCRGHENWVTSVCITSDGKIVSGSYDKTIRVWDMRGNQLAVCRGHEDEMNSVCVTQGGKIVSGSLDNTVRVWDMEGNQLAVSTASHEYGVYSVCVTHDGKIVSSSYDDRTVCVWDMEGNQLAKCSGHKSQVSSVCGAQNGKIVSSSYDRTVRVWDVGLLGKIARMDDDHARALWKLVQSIQQLHHRDAIDSQKYWKDIERLLEVEVSVSSPRGIWGTLTYLCSLCKRTRHRRWKHE